MIPVDPYFNLGPLNEMVNQDPVLLNNLLGIFIKDAESTRETLGLAIARADYRAMKELAHGLKGICSVLEMEQIQASSAAIEVLAYQKKDIAEIQAKYLEIESILGQVLVTLKAYLASVSSV